jgi:hypothetical protein
MTDRELLRDESLPLGWRRCEFCGCRTNALARACCERGRQGDRGNELFRCSAHPHFRKDCRHCVAQNVDEDAATRRAITRAAAAIGSQP